MSRSSRHRRCLVPALLCLIFASWSIADDRADVVFFESKIRPILVEKCYSCHSSRAPRPKGGLRLDSRAGVRRGGESGPPFDSKNVNESLLIKALQHAEDVSPMP
jgi:hypothetical protein